MTHETGPARQTSHIFEYHKAKGEAIHSLSFVDGALTVREPDYLPQ